MCVCDYICTYTYFAYVHITLPEQTQCKQSAIHTELLPQSLLISHYF